MPGPNLLQTLGSQSQIQTRFAPIFINRAFTGLYTQRNLLRDPSDSVREKFYGGRPDALITGVNVELTNRLTLARRPGLSAFSAATYPTAPDFFYSFRKSDGTIDVMVDTATVLYTDNQDGTKTTVLTKAAGAGQAQMQGVNSTLYIGDGVDLKKWNDFGAGVAGNNRDNATNPSWNWGIATPATAPAITITATALASSAWTANTVFSTMGLIVDSNGNVEQMISVNATGTNTTNFGTTGNGQPTWNQTPGGTTADGAATWTNWGPIVLRTPNTTYNNASVGGTLVNPCIVFDPVTKCCFVQAVPGNAQGTSSSAGSFTFGGGIGWNGWDGTVKWFNIGSLKTPPAWAPSHSYPARGSVTNDQSVSGISEPQTLANGFPTNQTIFWQVNATGGTFTSGTGGTSPQWATTTGAKTQPDGDLIWLNLGSATYATNHAYTAWTSGGVVFSVIKDPNNNMQACVISGTSNNIAPSTAFVLTAASNAVGGNTTYTGTFSPTLTPAYPVTITGFVTGANNGTFQIVSCNATQLVVQNSAGVAETHAGTATFNPWGTVYAAQTKDGTATWTCLGGSMSWAVTTKWYLPPTGFFPPFGSVPYGGASIIDTNANIQFVINSGKSGGGAPAFSTTVGGTTTDSGVTWIMVSAFTTQGFSWTKGHTWAFSYKSRTASDPYNTTAPPGWPSALGPPTGSGTGGVSTASPITTTTGGNPGAVVTLTGLGSTDPQVDTIVIWRDADETPPSQSSNPNMLFLTEIPNPPPIGGIAQPWTFRDFQPDSTLNPFVLAPINHANDPPPAGFLPDTYHFGRIWGHIGNTVYYTGGPDTLVGNGSETVPPTNNFVFPSGVTRSIATATGLLVFTTADTYIVAGGPATSTFFTQPLIPGTGLVSFNALDVHGGTIFLFTSDRQFVSIDPSAGESELGFPIGDQLSNFNPVNVYVTAHIAGSQDKAVFVADGATGWYRLNPNQAPESGPVWSPFAAITNGCKAVQSIEVTPGVHKLLVGSTGTNQPILVRDLNVFSDNGAAYASNFTMGCLVLAQPGQLAELAFITLDLARVGTAPTVKFLLDELSGTFTNFNASNVSDPPELWGASGGPTTLFSNRYYFNASMAGNTTPPPAWCRFMEVQLDYGNVDTVQNELLTLTIFGAHYQEK